MDSPKIRILRLPEMEGFFFILGLFLLKKEFSNNMENMLKKVTVNENGDFVMKCKTTNFVF